MQGAPPCAQRAVLESRASGETGQKRKHNLEREKGSKCPDKRKRETEVRGLGISLGNRPRQGQGQRGPRKGKRVRWQTGGSLRGLQPGCTAQNSQPPPRALFFSQTPGCLRQSSKGPKGVFPPVSWSL